MLQLLAHLLHLDAQPAGVAHHPRRVVFQPLREARRLLGDRRQAQSLASDKRFNVVHLIYREKPWDAHHKDYEFSAASMRDHWASGLADMRATLAHPQWLAPPLDHDGMVTHDVHRGNGAGSGTMPTQRRRKTP